eukprot:756383-Hanusia_phi.AAC.1
MYQPFVEHAERILQERQGKGRGTQAGGESEATEKLDLPRPEGPGSERGRLELSDSRTVACHELSD